MTTPEDRGPNSLRVVKYDRTNTIHEGLLNSEDVNNNIQVSVDRRTQRGTISMPVASGMEKQPARLTADQVAKMKAKVSGVPLPKKTVSPKKKTVSKPAEKKPEVKTSERPVANTVVKVEKPGRAALIEADRQRRNEEFKKTQALKNKKNNGL